MSRYKKWFSIVFISVCFPQAYGSPQIYLFLGREPAENYTNYLSHPSIQGVQIVYPWKLLEPQKDHYDFKSIERDLQILSAQKKSLFIQIQDKSFSPNVINVPDYLLSKKYDGGVVQQTDFPGEGKKITTGWVAQQWSPKVRARFQKLLIELGKRFDGQIQGINLTETAIDLDKKNLPHLFSCDSYFESVIDNMRILRSAFRRSDVVQYVNFFPCEWDNDHHYLSRLFDYAVQHQIGLGNPDAVPYRRGQMQNSYPFFHFYKGRLELVAIALQEPDYSYRNPKTGRLFTARELYDFADNYLGATIIFWNVQQPQFSQQVIPLLTRLRTQSGSRLTN